MNTKTYVAFCRYDYGEDEELHVLITGETEADVCFHYAFFFLTPPVIGSTVTYAVCLSKWVEGI